jgi:hypothetical protein
VTVARGGTGLTATPTNGQLLIGNGAGYTLATLTAGAGITVTNGAGSITVALTAPVSIANGGTNSSTALVNGRMMVSSAGKIIEASSVYSAGGNIQIGTQAVVVQPNFVYSGADSDTTGTAGPFMAFYTTATGFPMMSILPSTSGTSQIIFDAYLSGGNYNASGVVGVDAMRLAKNPTYMDIQYGPNTIGPGVPVTFSTSFRADTSGNVLIGLPRSLASQAPFSVIVPVQNTTSSINFYNSGDQYAHYTIVPYGTSGVDGSNNLWQTWDAYYDRAGAGWLSATNNTAFAWNKLTNTLTLNVATGLTKGAGVPWTAALQIDQVGNLTLSQNIFVSGIALVPELTTSSLVSSSGAIAHAFSALFYKNGHQVVCKLTDISLGSPTTTNGAINIIGIIPAGWRPSVVTSNLAGWVLTNALLSDTTLVTFVIGSAGSISILPTQLNGGNNVIQANWQAATGFQGGTNYLTWHTG